MAPEPGGSDRNTDDAAQAAQQRPRWSAGDMPPAPADKPDESEVQQAPREDQSEELDPAKERPEKSNGDMDPLRKELDVAEERPDKSAGDMPPAPADEPYVTEERPGKSNGDMAP